MLTQSYVYHKTTYIHTKECEDKGITTVIIMMSHTTVIIMMSYTTVMLTLDGISYFNLIFISLNSHHHFPNTWLSCLIGTSQSLIKQTCLHFCLFIFLLTLFSSHWLQNWINIDSKFGFVAVDITSNASGSYHWAHEI